MNEDRALLPSRDDSSSRFLQGSVPLQQVEDKGYAAPFASDPRTLYKIGVNFSSETQGIKEWKVK